MPGRGNRRFLHSLSGTGQQVSVDFDGVDETMAITSEVAIGIANSWSVGVWWKPSDNVNYQYVFVLARVTGGATESSIVLAFSANNANDPIEATIGNTAGLTFKSYFYNSLVTVGNWYFSVITWDGTTMTLNHNGVAQTPSSTPVDNPGTMDEPGAGRDVQLAQFDSSSFFTGRIHSVGIWDSVLSAAAISVLYNSGAGAAVNWGADSGAYSASADLQHWWRLGFDSSDMGKDYGIGSPLIDLDDASVNITAADIVADFPS